MNKTLLLRLAAPLQSWGVASKYLDRDTASEPTKSGVIGLLASALGRGRDECLEDLAKLRFGVRVDQPGKIIRDFQTAAGMTKQNKPTTHVTNRYYLSDAVFLVALEGDAVFINELADAVKEPYYPLFLGRRCCPATGQLLVGVVDLPLIDALRTTTWQASEVYKENWKRLDAYGIGDDMESATVRLVYDSGSVKGYVQQDVPVTFNWANRVHARRYVNEETVALREICTGIRVEHDPFSSLGGGE